MDYLDSTPFANISSIHGARVTMDLLPNAYNDEENNASIQLQLGCFVKIPTSKSAIFGVVTSMQIEDQQQQQCRCEVDLLGEALDKESKDGCITFRRGVSIYPGLTAPVYMASPSDLAQIYARPDEPYLRIGTIYQDESLPAYTLMDKLLTTHFAVLGNTGTGKSCTVALLLRSMLTAYPQGRIFMLDPHNEYSKAFGDMAELLNTSNLRLPYWLFNSEEITAVLVDQKSPTFQREKSLLAEAIVAAKEQYLGRNSRLNTVTVDTPVPYQMRDVLTYLHEKMGQMEQPDGVGPYMRLQTRIRAIQQDQRYSFIFPGMIIRDEMAEIIGRLMRLPVEDKPISIMDLSGVPAEITNVVISVICRLIFDFVTWSHQDTPILMVCEEAHRYIPKDESAGFAPVRKLISRIAQEGRKYGISLALVTQRPALISETILSQCSTLFALRMSNQRDQEIVYKSLPETAYGILNALPALRNQEVVVSGEGVTVPMRVKMSHLQPEWRPRSDSKAFSDLWQKDSWSKESVNQVVQNWRLQHEVNADDASVDGGSVVGQPADDGLANINEGVPLTFIEAEESVVPPAEFSKTASILSSIRKQRPDQQENGSYAKILKR